MTARTWHIYTLSDPRDGAVRYVGITHRDPRRRLSGHLWDATNDRRLPKSEWLCDVLSAGLKPICETVETGVGNGWDAEIRWVKHFRDAGCDLTNANDGGGGPRTGGKWTPEQREKITSALKGIVRTPEQCAAITARQIGHRPSDETRAKQAAAKLGKKRGPYSQEHRDRISASLVGKSRPPVSAEVRRQRSLALSGKPWSQARIDAERNRTTRGHSEETKAKMRATWARKTA